MRVAIVFDQHKADMEVVRRIKSHPLIADIARIAASEGNSLRDIGFVESALGVEFVMSPRFMRKGGETKLGCVEMRPAKRWKYKLLLTLEWVVES
jgi:hypothetical protein